MNTFLIPVPVGKEGRRGSEALQALHAEEAPQEGEPDHWQGAAPQGDRRRRAQLRRRGRARPEHGDLDHQPADQEEGQAQAHFQRVRFPRGPRVWCDGLEQRAFGCRAAAELEGEHGQQRAGESGAEILVDFKPLAGGASAHHGLEGVPAEVVPAGDGRVLGGLRCTSFERGSVRSCGSRVAKSRVRLAFWDE